MIIGICGYGTHGKGTVASYISRNTIYRYHESTSQAAGKVVFEQLKDRCGYKTVEEAWADRSNHRDEWAEIIWQYNAPLGLRLYQEMLSKNDIIEGVRKASEFHALKRYGLVNLTIWVDALERLPRESSSSCQVTADDCDIVVDNNGSLADLYKSLDQLIEERLQQPWQRPHVGAICRCSRGFVGQITGPQQLLTYPNGESGVGWVGIHLQDHREHGIKMGDPWSSRHPVVLISNEGD